MEESSKESLLTDYEELRRRELELLSSRHEQDVQLQKIRFEIAGITRRMLGSFSTESQSW
jgi:hypothetical protein